MATWGAHLRIAEKLLSKIKGLDEQAFLIGNVGPDCGKPNEDWSQFYPPKSISHWIDDNNEIRADKFHDKYLLEGYKDCSIYSFMLGYYIHLLTDIMWTKEVKKYIEERANYNKLKTDKNFIWEIKKDWYDLDKLYFRDHQSSLFHSVFKEIEDIPEYLDYYPKGAIKDRVDYIVALYSDYSGNIDREYVYLTENDMSGFIEEASIKILLELDIESGSFQ